MSATQTEVSCPKCGGPMWDNRATKKNPKAPDYKCRDKTCDGVIWPPRNGSYRSAPKPQAPAPREAGYIPGLDDGPDDELPPPIDQAYSVNGGPATNGAYEKLEALYKLYGLCLDQAVDLAKRHNGVTIDVTAAAATMFIGANQQGIRV